MPELLARVRAAVRRRVESEAPAPVYRVGTLEVDLVRRLVRVNGAQVRLSPKQYRLLQTLVRNAGKVVTHRQLLTDIWGAAHRDDVQYLRVFMRKLRSRIEADPARPAYLLTELGVGYRLRTPDQLDDPS
jgi:two-component system KDP operon response regulator KdpE